MSDSLTPGTFSGNAGEDAEEFIGKFKAYISLRNNADAAKAFPLVLKGNAYTWYVGLEDTKKTNFGEIEKAFLERYKINQRLHFSKTREIFSNIQGKNESVQDFVSKIKRTSALIALPPAMIMQAVLGGLRPNIRCHVLLQNPTTLEEVETQATLAETSLDNTQEESTVLTAIEQLREQVSALTVAAVSHPRERSRSRERNVRFDDRTSQPRPPTPVQMRRPIDHHQSPARGRTCYRCGKSHSLKHDCWAKGQICHNCGKMGHIKSVCNMGKRGSYYSK